MNVVAIITLPDDQSGEADEMTGIEDVLCRSNFHPYKTVARHTDFVGADLWNGVRDEKKATCGCLKRGCRHGNSLDNARPRHGGRWIETFKIYQPDREARCDCPACSWDLRQELLDGSALAQLSARVDTTIELAQRSVIQELGFTFGGLFFRREFPVGANRGLPAFQFWTAPQLDEIAYFQMADAPYSRLVLGIPEVSISDAFARLAGWRPFLPGLIKESDTPIIAALRVAFWLRRCDRLRFVAVKPGENARDVPLHNAGDILAELRAFHSDREILQRKAPSGLRILRRADLGASYQVIQHATLLSLCAVQAKARWHDKTFNGDRTIIELMLGDGRSARDIAAELEMSASMVSRRFRDAIDAIAESLGSHFGKFVPRVETETHWPEKRTDKPKLWTGPPRPRLETGYKFRDVAMAMAFDGDPGREKQWGGGSLNRRVKLTPMDTLWAIDDYLAKSNIRRLPSGCAEDYPPETPSRFDIVVRAANDDGNVVEGDTDTTRSAGLFIRHWYNQRPRATDWRKIAHKLPAELKKPALEQENLITSLLADGIPSPYAPTSPVERRRFTTPYVNRLQDFYPREARDGSTTYGDVTVWPDGTTEPASEKRRRLAKKASEAGAAGYCRSHQ
jgi:hypothetical protein